MGDVERLSFLALGNVLCGEAKWCCHGIGHGILIFDPLNLDSSLHIYHRLIEVLVSGRSLRRDLFSISVIGIARP